MPFTWQRPPSIAFGGLAEAYAMAIEQNVNALAERYANEIETWMKSNAVWTDQTGDARRELYSETFGLTNEAVVIILGHGVDYGVFLELANAGRYSVIFPAMDYFIPRIWDDVRRILGR
jgi:hypothetical protein